MSLSRQPPGAVPQPRKDEPLRDDIRLLGRILGGSDEIYSSGGQTANVFLLQVSHNAAAATGHVHG